MTRRRNLLISATALIGLSLTAPTAAWSADAPIPVVATFSILGDMVKRIGGDRVDVTTLVGANGDAHVYHPTPADARAVSQAEILVFNGLAFEGWLDRLVEASGFGGVRVVATDGIQLIRLEDDDDRHDDHARDDHDHAAKDDHADGHDHGAFDPHAWQNLANAVIYVDNIAAALAKADPANASTYYGNRAAYVAEIEALDAKIRETVEGLSENRRTIVTAHDAFGYFSKAYGLRFVAPSGISTESDPSAADVAALIRQIREKGIKAVFVESITDQRLLEQIADETGASIGGTLYSDALSGPDGPASTYLDMMRHNVEMLAGALSS
ncbi:MAG: metal ABC transporter substrate-binding protein [Alphaproteobacteria bacterium]|nr:metal ABC transporter substrate-binding protein [Alphaproteobacteria bacterium]